MADLTPQQKERIKKGLQETNERIREAIKELEGGDGGRRSVTHIGEAIRRKIDTLNDYPPAGQKGLLNDFQWWYLLWDDIFDLLIRIFIMLFTGKTYIGHEGHAFVVVTLERLLRYLADKISLLEQELQFETDPEKRRLLRQIINELKRIKRLVEALSKKKGLGIFGRLWMLWLLFLIFLRLRYGLYIKYAKKVWGKYLTLLLEYYILVDNYLEKALSHAGKMKRTDEDIKKAKEELEEAEKKKKELEDLLEKD